MRARAIAVLALSLACAAIAAAACTTFDGLTAQAPAVDASVPDTSPPPPPPADAGKDAPSYASYLSPADGARVCSLVFRCPELASSIIASIAVPVDPTNFALCMDWLTGPLPSTRVGVNVQAGIFECVAHATTCAAATLCLPLENLAPNDARCPPDAGAERCADDGGTVLRCSDGYALHCTSAFYATGSRCIEGSDHVRWCALQPTCTAGTQCIGSLLEYCSSPGGLDEEVNCAASGYTCGVDPEAGSPDCLTATAVEPCSAVGTDCAGTSVAACDGSELSRFDCAALGGTCSKKGGPAHCVRPADACSPFDTSVNACSGSTIALCTGGTPVSFDCGSIGLSCKPAAGAQSSHCG